MSTYRQGTVLGLTIAETFILLAFLLLIALLGFAPPPDDAPQVCELDVGTKTVVWTPETSTESSPQEWVRPEEIETLVSSAEQARNEKHEAEQALADAEQELSQAHEQAEESRKEAEEARRALNVVGSERDEARRALALAARGERPPCWYQIVDKGQGNKRHKAHYAFNVAIYENSIEMAPRPVPPGGADDDEEGPNADKLYVDEWQQLNIDDLPYGKALSEVEFTDAVQHMVAQGKSGQVRSYECVFSVMVWDKLPAHAKERWQYAHDDLIEGRFSAYTAKDLEWKGID